MISTVDFMLRPLHTDNQKRRTRERLEVLLLRGLESGKPTDVTDDYIQRKRAELLARIEGDRKRAD